MRTKNDTEVLNADVKIELSHENMVQLNVALQQMAFDLLSEEAWDASTDNKYMYEPYMTATVDGEESKWLIWSLSMYESRISIVLLTRYHGEMDNEYLDVIAVLPAMRTVYPPKVVPQRMVRLGDVDMSAVEDIGALYRYFA